MRKMIKKYKDIRALYLRGELGEDYRDLEHLIHEAKNLAHNTFGKKRVIAYMPYDFLVWDVKHSDLGGFFVALVVRERRVNPE